MEAKSVGTLPVGGDWQYEPKWDGFRCLAWRDGDRVDLASKSGRPLGRYFPDMQAALAGGRRDRFLLDGELLVPVGGVPSFEATQMRLHPAASRVARLAAEHPARFMVFDLLSESGTDLGNLPLHERRHRLEAYLPGLAVAEAVLSPASRDPAQAQRWLDGELAGCDGVVAKRLDLPYRAGLRDGMQKIKRIRSADCVVGGFRYLQERQEVGSLLLGLYDGRGLLDHVGFTSAIAATDRPALTRRLQALVEPPGFTGKAPGGPSRWSDERTADWQPVRPEIVVEVAYDHVSDGRFRHGTRLLRFRPDKAPQHCTMEQIVPSSPMG